MNRRNSLASSAAPVLVGMAPALRSSILLDLRAFQPSLRSVGRAQSLASPGRRRSSTEPAGFRWRAWRLGLPPAPRSRTGLRRSELASGLASRAQVGGSHIGGDAPAGAGLYFGAPAPARTFPSPTSTRGRTRVRLTRSKSRPRARRFARIHRRVCSTAFKPCCNWWKDRRRRQPSRKLKFTIGPPSLTGERWST